MISFVLLFCVYKQNMSENTEPGAHTTTSSVCYYMQTYVFQKTQSRLFTCKYLLVMCSYAYTCHKSEPRCLHANTWPFHITRKHKTQSSNVAPTACTCQSCITLAVAYFQTWKSIIHKVFTANYIRFTNFHLRVKILRHFILQHLLHFQQFHAPVVY